MERREFLFWRKVGRKNKRGCRNWKGVLDEKGYGHVTYKGYATTAHRIAFILTKGKIPSGMIVMHSCDNRSCCNPEHLKAATQAENLADMRTKGRGVIPQARGEMHGMCKLKFADVRLEIRHLYAETRISRQSLAEKFKVSQSQIGRIIRCENRLTE